MHDVELLFNFLLRQVWTTEWLTNCSVHLDFFPQPCYVRVQEKKGMDRYDVCIK